MPSQTARSLASLIAYAVFATVLALALGACTGPSQSNGTPTVVVITAAAGAGSADAGSLGPSPTPAPTWTDVPAVHETATAAPTSTPVPTPIPVLQPARIKIPKIKVDAAVVPIGMSQEGEMDAPTGPDIVGWYRLGPKPGEPGNVLLTGHLDWKTQTAVFWRLRELKPGDTIAVQAADNKVYEYKVEQVTSYPRASAPVDQIVGYAIGSVVTIVTCDGTFDRQAKDYDRRLIVRARLIQAS